MNLSELGVCYFPDGNPKQVQHVARLCERLAFGFLGVGDVQSLWADVYVELTQAATITERIALGPWVTNPLTRHPSVTANAIASLREISGGRCFLGIGVGDGALRGIGAQPATLPELESAVLDIRERGAKRTGDAPFPIYWASASRRSTELGARMADGVIVSGWIVPEMLAESMSQIRYGASERSETPPIPIFNTALSVDSNSAAAINGAKPYVARALARPSSAKVPGWSSEDVERFRAAYDFSHHFKSEQSLRDLVPDEMVPKKAVAGTPAECARQLETIIDSGFERIALIPIGDIDATLEILAHEIAPLVRARG